MAKIARLTFLAPPNYVLRTDPYYSKIWQLYLDLLRQKKITEIVWKARHRLFQEYFNLLTCLVLDLNYTPLYRSPLWIRLIPKNGQFLSETFFSRVCQDVRGKIFDFSIQGQHFCKSTNQPEAQFSSQGRKIPFALYFIPWNCKDLLSLPVEDCRPIIYNESGAQIRNSHHGMISFNPGTIEGELKQLVKGLVS